MANALDAVLALQQNRQQQQQQQSENLTQAVNMFNQMRQQSIANQFMQKNYRAGLAERGLKENSDGSFARDLSLMSPADLFLQQGKMADAYKNLVESGFINAQGGGGSGMASLLPGGGGTTASGGAPSSAPAGSGDALVPSQFNALGVATGYMNPVAEKQKEIIKGPAEAAVGKIALANESIKNIDDIKKALFPDGTPKSFDRNAAFQGNTPHPKLPFVGDVGPQFIPTEKGQDIFRKMGASLSARQLIQTGVAARPEETEKLVSQFAPNAFSNPESAFKGLNELQNFYKDYLNTAQPEKRLGKQSQSADQANASDPFKVGDLYNGEKILSVKRIK